MADLAFVKDNLFDVQKVENFGNGVKIKKGLVNLKVKNFKNKSIIEELIEDFNMV